MHSDYILQNITLLLEAINESFRGKKAEIAEIEEALNLLDKEVLEKLSKQSPDKILKYISQKVDLKLKIEELKQKKEITIWHLFKSLMPFLAPIAAAFVGLLIGVNLPNTSNLKIEYDQKLENMMILEALDIRPKNKRNEKLNDLIELGIIEHHREKVKELVNLTTETDSIEIVSPNRVWSGDSTVFNEGELVKPSK
ncbi:hypothetical protein [Arcticibacterium luteifluviistationis]|uniref:Uncharacterized protein n=1 Tax=Arcticibacterium luteifluviistationis TaxID=1784714 RepID=A0A2Z4GH79_9BACT|nr:hypothetical protein [Arcticibacterium luteifluviistationis]AWW00552.1 hypothetical protein DJ013_21140 [Arcticibacterium luteifluviistationis]